MRATAWLRRRWWIAALTLVLVGLAGMTWLVAGAVESGRERRSSRERIEGLAQQIAVVVDQINGATSPEARERQAATLAGAIAALQRSIDCAALYAQDERPAACADVARRMDAIRAGADPFARPPTGAP